MQVHVHMFPTHALTLSMGVACMFIQQVTRDWLLMEMSDTSLNDSMFEDIADAADLPDSCRPQVAAVCQTGRRAPCWAGRPVEC